MTLRIYGPAQADIEAAFAYIAQDSPRAAQTVVERILSSLESLPEHPNMGRPGRVEGTAAGVMPGNVQSPCHAPMAAAQPGRVTGLR